MYKHSKRLTYITSITTGLLFTPYVHFLTNGAFNNLNHYYKWIPLVFIPFIIPHVVTFTENLFRNSNFWKAVSGGRSYVSGYWIFDTKTSGDDNFDISSSSLYCASYNENGDLRPEATRLIKSANNIGWSSSNSNYASVNQNGDYFNQATINYKGMPNTLLAWGRFKISHRFRNPSIYDGHVVVVGESNVWQQYGRKISDGVIKDYVHNHSDKWQHKLLEDYASGKLNI